MSQKRNFYRLTYTGGHGPRLEVGDRKYQILDLSEQGLRIRLPPKTRLPDGTRVGGYVVFLNGDRFAVSGTVLRSQNFDCILQLSEGIPLSKIMDEQLRMIKAAKGE